MVKIIITIDRIIEVRRKVGLVALNTSGPPRAAPRLPIPHRITMVGVK
jgi:hypothetical protein